LSEDWFEVVEVDCSIASIPFFRVNIWFGTKTTRIKPGDKVELREILRPPYLPLDQHLGSRKILKVFMIYNNVDGIDSSSNVAKF